MHDRTLSRAFALGLLVAFAAACSDASVTEVEDAFTLVESYAAVDLPTGSSGPVASAPVDLSNTPLLGLVLSMNGSFETNDGASSFGSWSEFNAGNGNWDVQSGTTSPLTGAIVDGPTDGTFAAMTDQGGPGTHILYQDIAVPNGAVELRFDVYIANRSNRFVTRPSLSVSGGPNQQFRADVMDPNASVDDVGAGVLLNVYQTQPGDPLIQSYQTVVADLTPFGGQTVRIRFAEVDNLFFFNVGIDNVVVELLVIPVDIDIKPGSDPNSINARSRGVTPVAVLTTDDFDAATIDFATVRFGPGGAAPAHGGHLEDVDNDGDTDAVFHFPTQDTGLVCGDTEATLTGQNTAGFDIEGTDSVNMVGCNSRGRP